MVRKYALSLSVDSCKGPLGEDDVTAQAEDGSKFLSLAGERNSAS